MAYLYIVQHPIIEPSYGRAKAKSRLHIPWNTTGTHRRKFIKHDGFYLKNGKCVKNSLHFWGEYEPPTNCTITHGYHIKAIHDILYSVRFLVPIPPGSLNTDPYVFGNHFKHICCGMGNRIYKNGDVILFGKRDKSGIYFLLDTVFVVKDKIEIDFSRNTTQYYKAAIEPLLNLGHKKDCFFRGENYFLGKKYFSFVPCLIDYQDIERPKLDIKGLGFKVVPEGHLPWNPSKIEFNDNIWKKILDAVKAAGWEIGIQLDKI